MPWNKATPEMQRVKFVSDYLDQPVSFSELCRQYGVSRKTGYKWLKRFDEAGIEGLRARTRAPRRHPNETPEDVVLRLLDVRQRHPTWGPRKIVAYLERHEPQLKVPAPSTVGAVLKRHGLVTSRRHRARAAHRDSPLTNAKAPNDVWCADFKGNFSLQRKPQKQCHPLTVSDLHSRFLVGVQALGTTKHAHAYPVFLALFREFGLPSVIRTDNGVPFSSRAPGGMSRLAVWWIRLGISPERIEPGHPEQNGSHERMHRTMKAEATKPAERTLMAQQRRFSVWRREFNNVRPHEALNMLTPSDCYSSSSRFYPRRFAKPEYADDDVVRIVRDQGETSFQGRAVQVGKNLAGHPVAFRAVENGRFEVRFFDFVIGKIDLRDKKRLRPR